jgi:hypothetical protein
MVLSDACHGKRLKALFETSPRKTTTSAVL